MKRAIAGHRRAGRSGCRRHPGQSGGRARPRVPPPDRRGGRGPQASGQTFVAIEAYSGAIALKRGSMLAYLKRGEAHQRRGEAPDALSAALRDLRSAAELAPSDTRTLEELGDVNFQLKRFANAARELRGVSPPRRSIARGLLQAGARLARRRAPDPRDLCPSAGGHAESHLSRGALRAGPVPEGSRAAL